MSTNYLLGIDFGGGASKATLIDTAGNIVAEHTVEYPMLYPGSGACEQEPADWIRALCENAQAILSKSGVDGSRILAVALDSATHTAVVCDGAFRPLRPAIHWTDTRSRKQAQRLNDAYGDDIFQKTGHRPGTIWTLPQLCWMREEEPQLFSQIRHVFFEKDYIRYFLTGTYGTDVIEAQGSMLFNCQKQEWDEDLCCLAGISSSVLPPLFRPTDVVGTVTVAASRQTGLVQGTPVICGTTDTALEVFASGAVNQGDVTVKLATAGRICVITDRSYPDPHLVNYAHVVDGLWYPGTATKAAASSYRWYRDTFGGDYRELDQAAMNIPMGCDGLIFHPYLNGELTPYGDPQLCGSFIGMRATHTHAHFTRAVLEGVALSLLDNKLYLDSLGIPYGDTATMIGGGSKSPLWRQITADMLGIPLVITETSDSSFGSAMLAGVATGVFSDAAQAAKQCVHIKDRVDPLPEHTQFYRELFLRYKKIHDALAPIYQEF